MTRTNRTNQSSAIRREHRFSRASLALALCATVSVGGILGIGVTPSTTGLGGPGTVSVQPVNSSGAGLVAVTPSLTGLGGPGTM